MHPVLSKMLRLQPVVSAYIHTTLRLHPFHLCIRDVDREISERVIGDANISIDGTDHLCLQWFRINPEHQGLGYGRQFYHLIEEHIRTDLHHNTIHLMSVYDAHPFWLKMGFHQNGLRTDQITPMVKNIS